MTRSRSTRPRSARGSGDFDFGVVLLIAVVIATAGWFWIQLTPAIDSTGRTSVPSSPAALVYASPSAAVSPSPSPDASPEPSPSPSPVPSRAPVRAPVNVSLLAHPAAYFNSEATKVMCADAGIQIVVNVLNRPARPNRTRAFQDQIAAMARGLTTRSDSRNGGWGPLGMAAAITDLSGVDYELRIYRTRAQAVRASAIAVEATKQPVIWLAWRGAHSWVMTGFRASADPRLFSNATISGVYILDPWFPRISTIWGPSDPPGTFQNAAEMTRNFLPWRRPEGTYPGRDGRFLVIMPLAAPKA